MKVQTDGRWRKASLSTPLAILNLCLACACLGEVVSSSFSVELQSGSPSGVRAKSNTALLVASEIHGSVRIQSRIQPKSMAISMYSRRSGRSTGAPIPSPVNEVENVVLYLEGNTHHGVSSFVESQDINTPLAEAPVSARGQPRPSIRQINETFWPHVLPITTGTIVEFPNGDPFFHNVFSLSSAKSFDLGRYPQGQIRWVRFDKPGIVKVFCHIHSHMSAVILVFDHHFFTVPDSKGEFVLGPVPPGSYTLVGWHERLKPVRQRVTVDAHEPLAVNLVL